MSTFVAVQGWRTCTVTCLSTSLHLRLSVGANLGPNSAPVVFNGGDSLNSLLVNLNVAFTVDCPGNSFASQSFVNGCP